MGNFDNQRNNKSGNRDNRGSGDRFGNRDNRGSGDRSRNSGFNRGSRDDFRPREKHKAVCDECKKECEVPFKPTEGRPVYCSECFKKQDRNQRF